MSHPSTTLLLLFSSLACAGTPAALVSTAGEGETLLLQMPAVSETHVVFAHAGDLWLVPRSGGDARRLTSHAGIEVAPRLSPDGRWVAFSGEYEGNRDVYVVAVDGGAPRRLTWHPEEDVVLDWHPDGERVLFRSMRASATRDWQAFLVDLAGGTPVQHPLPKVFHAAYDETGARLAYTPLVDAFRSWKRYRGGRVPPVWILDAETFEVEEVPHGVASDTFPCWLDGTVYFASDRDGHMNVWRYVPGSGEVEQVTRFEDYDVRNMDAGGGVLAFEQAGAIHLYDPRTERTSRLSIQVRADDLFARARWQEVGDDVRGASLAPNGKRAIFEARGEIVTLPREHGDPRNLTATPGVHERSPLWSPDGQRVAWFSDEGGEYRLVVRDHLGREEARSYDLGGGGFYHDPLWSPDGKHVLFTDKANRLAYVTLESGAVTEVTRVAGALGAVRPSAAWSPDSQWIAFESRNPATLYDKVSLHSLASGASTPITDAFGSAGGPAFSPDGAYLFFTASVDVGPKLFGLDMSSSAAREAAGSVYVAVLKADGKSPLAPRSDEGLGEEDDEEEDGKDGQDDEDGGEEEDAGAEDAEEDGGGDDAEEEAEEATEAAPAADVPSIDLEGLDQRILALPIDPGRLAGLACAKGKLFYLRLGEGGEAVLEGYDLEERKAEKVLDEVRGFELARDGKSLLVARSRNRWSITDLAAKEHDELAVAGVKVFVDPAAEWPQMLREVWRIQRDYFYDPAMHGVDWQAMWERWSVFLPHVRHRADLTLLFAELIGELACGHQYVFGGEMPEVDRGVSVGLLGADWEVDGGRHRIARIYGGQNWNPSQRAPLTAPGVDAREGDYLIAVNGRPVGAGENLYQAFENTADRQVDLTLSANADGSEPRTTRVVPVGSERELRRLSWIERNRRRVDELSGGRLAYVYMPNTGDAGRAAFDRDFYSQLDREGLILDERYNGGGQVADYVIDVLSREVMSYWLNREQWLSRSPFAMIDGPKVMVINESAGSGGDWMPWTFQRRGLGKLVGTRTWGGLVGISGYPPLMDGGGVTAANFGVLDEEGRWAVENAGVTPDVEVVEWPAEILAGRDPQLEKAVAIALEELAQRPPRSRPTYQPPAAR